MLSFLKNIFKKSKTYYANPVVQDCSDSSHGTIKIFAGHDVIVISEEQAKNLWGELGSVLRKRKNANLTDEK